MPDREKVIKALEICATGISSCDGCPMKDNCKGTSNAAMAAAIQLLRNDEEEKMQVLKELEESLLESARMFHEMQIRMRR